MSSPLKLPITTRGIGINLCAFYADVVGLLPTPGMCTVELPKIYASYRALLALVESRLYNLDRIACSIEHYPYSPILSKYYKYDSMFIPFIFKRLLEAINILPYRDVTYFPAMAKNTVIEGKFIPRPENIILSNLRQTVEALTETSDDGDRTLKHRRNFYKNNPIPGAIWNDNCGLINANEIIPPEYDLHYDVDGDMRALKSLGIQLREYSNYIAQDSANQNKKQRSFSSCISNQMGDLRVPDRKCAENLYDYYHHSRPKNNIDEFYSRFKLRSKVIINEGALFLLGECPNDESIAKPIYDLRSEHVNSYFYPGYTYKTSYLSYHNGILAKTLQNA